MPKASPSRRKLIVFILLGFALTGGAMRLLAPRQSLAHDIGNLLLVLWVPVIGNVVAYVVRRARPTLRPGSGFRSGQRFTPHLLASMTPLGTPALPGTTGQKVCTLVLASDGFTARLSVTLDAWMAAGETRNVELELLRPELALPRLQPQKAFTVLAGQATVGRGVVLELFDSLQGSSPTKEGATR